MERDKTETSLHQVCKIQTEVYTKFAKPRQKFTQSLKNSEKVYTKFEKRDTVYTKFETTRKKFTQSLRNAK